MTRNKFEEDLAKQLRKAKVKFEYERNRFNYTINGTYIPDFTIPGDPPIFLEGKGKFDAITKRKMAAVKKSNPDADIRMVFMGKAHWKSGQSNIRWCVKHNFPYTFETIPAAWLRTKSKNGLRNDG